MITYSERDRYTLIVKVPYKIKDEFKRDFPGVRWDEKERGWILLANATVRERLSIFADRMSGPAKKAADLEFREYTYAEIKALEFRAAELQRTLTEDLDKAESLDTLLFKLNAAKSTFESVRAKHLNAVATGKAKLIELKATIDELMAPYDIDSDISTMSRAWKNYNGSLSYVGDAELRTDFDEAKASILDSYNDIYASTGVSLNTLKRLSEINWEDRSGPIPQVVCRDLYRDLTFPTASNFQTTNNYNNQGEHHA